MPTRRTRNAVVTLVLTLVAAGCRGPEEASTPPLPIGERLYVTDEAGATVAVLDPATVTVIARVPLDHRPRGLRVSDDGTTLLVALSPPASGTPRPADVPAVLPGGLGLIDVTARAVRRVVPAALAAYALAADEAARRLYLSDEAAGELVTIDLETGEVAARVGVGDGAAGVSLRPGGSDLYVAAAAAGQVVVVDAATLAVRTRIPVPGGPRTVVFSRDGEVAFVTQEDAGTIAVIATDTRRVVGGIPLPAYGDAPSAPRPAGAVLSPDGSRVYVALGAAQSIAVIDVGTRSLVKTIDGIGGRPWDLAVSLDGRRLYTANGPSADVSIVDLATSRTVHRIDVGGTPWGVAVGTGP